MADGEKKSALKIIGRAPGHRTISYLFHRFTGMMR